MALHKCKAIDCDRRVSVNKLMCYEHWAMVPAGLKNDCYLAFRAWKGAMSRSASEAVAAGEALTSVQARCVRAVGLRPLPVKEDA